MNTLAVAMIRYAFTIAAIALLGTATSTHSVATPSPVARIIYSTFARLQSYPVPSYAIWTATWRIQQTPMGYYTHTSSSIEVHRYAVRLSDGLENISDPVPSGKLPPALIAHEFLGPFAWTLRTSVNVPPSNGVSLIPDIEGLKTIARVVVFAQPAYVLANSSTEAQTIEDVDGHPTYHLQLRPTGDPRKHNLRDLWIDVATHDLRKAHFVGTYAPFPGAPISDTDVTVYFRSVVGCWVVTQALWTYDDPPTHYDFDVKNDEIALEGTLPDWLFDAAGYHQHQLAGEPDYIGELLDRLRSGGN
ncbi:MAG TPA: hypothetical protein VEW74_09060 [Candidatus Nitrosotalea sp.]|nr:hypothetical protein [Candidatus Nitrosotalea sp.]